MSHQLKAVRLCLFFLFILSASTAAQAQVAKTSELFKALKANDSLLFERAFNNCEIRQLEKLISEDFEFYHDVSGITTSKEPFIKSIRDGICKLEYKPRRELVEGSLEVFPLKKNGTLYGAIQTGRHRFFAIEKDKPEYFTSIARFTHVWMLENGDWKLKRGLSYDHLTEDAPAQELALSDEQMEAWLRESNVPALGLGIIKDGKLQQVKVYGELKDGKTAPYNTIFNVASLAKP
ncbi:MAG: nuclear transport factor 2 family protein, partial [Hymenobacteraceae bacterium]|nr:nuclear transport factor 2 family protein [Hymenobacteraceae bacterium]